MDDLSQEPVFQRVTPPADFTEEGVASEPALADADSASDARAARRAWYVRQWERPQVGSRLRVFLALSAASGLFAIVCAIGKGAVGWGTIAVVVGAPVVEEVGKAAGPLMVLEKRPWIFRGASSLLLIGITSGFVFATVENLLYFFVYIGSDELTPGLALWRLTVCTALHVAGATVSCAGLARAWTRAAHEKCAFTLDPAIPFFVAAMVLHGVYNLGAVVWTALVAK